MLLELLWILSLSWTRLMQKVLRQSYIVPVIHFTDICGERDFHVDSSFIVYSDSSHANVKTQITLWT